MLFTHPYHTLSGAQKSTTQSSAEQEGRSSVHIPTVYSPLPPARWEYHVLTLDPREDALPDAEQFNALGSEGWILAGLLDERLSGAGKLIHYYFVRQTQE